jgi:hypothetical protein
MIQNYSKRLLLILLKMKMKNMTITLENNWKNSFSWHASKMISQWLLHTCPLTILMHRNTSRMLSTNWEIRKSCSKQTYSTLLSKPKRLLKKIIKELSQTRPSIKKSSPHWSSKGAHGAKARG